jgi:hypothetical protein
MQFRYDIRPDSGEWTVYDTVTALPALVNGMSQRLLPKQEARELADALSQLVLLEIVDPDVGYKNGD